MKLRAIFPLKDASDATALYSAILLGKLNKFHHQIQMNSKLKSGKNFARRNGKPLEKVANKLI